MLLRLLFSLVKCWRCKVAVDQHVLYLSTRLGPPSVSCRWCGARVATGRIEWQELGWLGRIWFWLVSAVYLAIAFLLGGLCVTSVTQFWRGDGTGQSEWRLAEPLFLVSGLVACGAVALLQQIRVTRSRMRTAAAEQRVPARPPLRFEVSGQTKVLTVLALPIAICRLLNLRNTHPLWPDAAIVAAVALAAWIMLGPRITRRRWAARESADHLAAAGLFEVVSEGLDVTGPVRWNYVLSNIPQNRLDEVQVAAVEMGFDAGMPRVDQKNDDRFLVTLSENRLHTAESYAQRLMALQNYAGIHKFMLADCSTGA